MAELWFIGAGLDDERGLGRSALEILGRADAIFADEYTASLAPGSFERLAEELKKPIRRLTRSELEAGGPVLEALGRGGPVALVVPGDPFAATTHVALRLAVERSGHDWRYLPNASVLTAAGAFLGLMLYRFGGPVSVPFSEPGFAPTSPLERIARNRSLDLHTLVLLDLRPAEDRFLTASEALRILVERDPSARVLSREGPVGVVARVGTPSACAWWGTPHELASVDFGPPLHSIVVPAPTLHFEEEAAIARFRVRPTL